jgi:hypothetical protein
MPANDTGNGSGTGSGAHFAYLLFWGALGAEVVAFTQLLGRDQLDIPLTVSLYCFALSLPFLVLGIMLFIFASRARLPDRGIAGRVLLLSHLLGLLPAFIGLVSLFCHFSALAALLFAGSSVACVVLALIADKTGLP